jgi:hypothetical protein
VFCGSHTTAHTPTANPHTICPCGKRCVSGGSWLAMGFRLESKELRSAGIIGTNIYAISSLICLWRTIIEFSLLFKSFKYNVDTIMKIVFYLSLTLNSLCELIYSISLVIENRYVKFGYTFHLCGLLAIFVAFSTSIYQWCAVLFRIDERRKYIFFLQIFLAINILSSIISIGILCTSLIIFSLSHSLSTCLL